jgi:hypothetical protein
MRGYQCVLKLLVVCGTSAKVTKRNVLNLRWWVELRNCFSRALLGLLGKKLALSNR